MKRNIVAAVIASVLPCMPGLASAEVPYLRIEPGGHYAGVTRLSADKEQQYLVSSSKDKTARLWDLSSKKLLRVYRPPIGPGTEGFLYAVAIAPDASIVATGGIDRKVYLFERQTGKIARVLDQPSSVLHLEYSSDGRFMVVALAGNRGFTVYETSAWSKVATAGEPAANTYYVSMGPDYQIASASDDGFVRLYRLRPNSETSLQLIGRREFIQEYPRSATFSPDGSKLAVAFAKNPHVEILSIPTFATLGRPSLEGCIGANWQSYMVTLAWSPDGTALYGGGKCQKSRGKTFIRAWSSDNIESFEDFRVSEDSIEHMVSLTNGNIAFASNDPKVGVLSPNGTLELLSHPAIPDYRGMGNNFLVNETGTTVEVTLERGREPIQFALSQRRLQHPSVFNLGGEPLYAPVQTTKGRGVFGLFGGDDELSVTDWEHSTSPKLNRTVLQLEGHDIAHSLAIAASRDRFVLGSESALQCYDRSGKRLWRRALPAPAWNTNISHNGMLTIAALGDGTIRWYLMRDGVEIAALLLHRNRNSWVIWTPQGYFDAEQGAENLVGWHLNQGKDHEGVYFPISRFFDNYYRPDYVDQLFGASALGHEMLVLQDRPETKAVLQENRLPPSVVIRNFPDSSEDSQVQIDIEAEDKGGGIDEIRLFVNGKALDTKTRGIQAIAIEQNKKYVKRHVTIDLLSGENVVRAVAYSRDRIEGTAAQVTIYQSGIRKESTLHVIAIGINEYQNTDLNLDFARLDAEGIISHFSSGTSSLFKSVHYHTLFDREATKEGILRVLRSIELKAPDEVILFLGGHGETDGTSWYFIPYELVYPERQEELRNKALSSAELQEEIINMGATKILVLLDSCKSGAALTAFSTRGVEDRKALAQLVRASGAHVVAAATKDQEASEAKQLGHGVFTYTLLQGIRGGADGSPKDGVVTVRELLSFVEATLPDVSQKYKAKAQYPVAYSMGNDFPIWTVP